jgi:hypothetical protein
MHDVATVSSDPGFWTDWPLNSCYVVRTLTNLEYQSRRKVVCAFEISSTFMWEPHNLDIHLFSNVYFVAKVRRKKEVSSVSSIHYGSRWLPGNYISVPRLEIYGRYPPLKIAVPAKQGAEHHWWISKPYTGLRVPHGFPCVVYLRLHNEIVQATSRGHTKLQKCKCSRHQNRRSPIQKV